MTPPAEAGVSTVDATPVPAPVDDIPPHIFLIFALYGKSREEITRSNLPATPRNLSPTRLLTYFQCMLSEEMRTNALIERARNLSTRVHQCLPPTSNANKVEDDQIAYIKHILDTFRWNSIIECTHVLGNVGRVTHPSPNAQLNTVASAYVRQWNSVMATLHGRWLFLYGEINRYDLEIQDLHHLVSIMQIAMQHKLIKFIEFPTRGEYLKAKRNAKTILSYLTASCHLSTWRDLTQRRRRNFVNETTFLN